MKRRIAGSHLLGICTCLGTVCVCFALMPGCGDGPSNNSLTADQPAGGAARRAGSAIPAGPAAVSGRGESPSAPSADPLLAHDPVGSGPSPSAIPEPATPANPAASPPAAPASGKGTLDAALAALKIPPDWYDAVQTHYDTTLPWKDARLEIRRLLGLGGESARQAIKLTCIYREKNDIGDGHEYPMYLFMGGEIAWATKAYIEFTQALLANPNAGDQIHAFLSLAACYLHFGEYERALATLNTAMARLPAPPWRIARQADIHDRLGDLYARQGDKSDAKKHYAEAVRLYPASDQPFGRHLLKQHATRVQSKLDLLDYESLETAKLRDGVYTAQGLGYSGDKELTVTLTIQSGRIAKIHVDHAEKIDQGATTILPERIVASQSLRVDAITGATVTCDAIIDAAFRALKQAGLE